MGYAKIRPRRGTEAEWSLVNPVIDEGELIMIAPDSGVGTGLTKFKIGDGKTKYVDLPYAFDAQATEIVGGTVDAFHTISLRTGTTNEWLAADPVLGENEVVYDSTKNGLKVGNGVKKFSELDYIAGSGSEEEIDFDFGDEDL